MPLAIFEHLVVGPLMCNCYIAGDPETKQAVVIDPGGDAQQIVDAIAKHRLQILAIVCTHAHFDHFVAADAVKAATGAPFFLHAEDEFMLSPVQQQIAELFGIRIPPPPEMDRAMRDNDELSAGSVRFQVLHTPGHSPGSVSLLVPEEAVFSGDTLFAGSVGRVDLPGGDGHLLLTSIEQRLLPLGDLTAYPGHGPPTTIDREKLTNPFL